MRHRLHPKNPPQRQPENNRKRLQTSLGMAKATDKSLLNSTQSWPIGINSEPLGHKMMRPRVCMPVLKLSEVNPNREVPLATDSGA